MQRILSVLCAGAALIVTGCSDAVGPVDPGSPSMAASKSSNPTYVVKFNDDVVDVPGLARRLAAANGGTIRFTYQRALKGFAVSLPPAAVAALARNPGVAFVEADQIFSNQTTQNGATWGLDRIDQRSLPLNSTYKYTKTGAGVTAYIIDTGIRLNHSEFGARATSGFDAVDGGQADDCNGHGTHVAGTVGGQTYGVAKGVRLVAVRVLDCEGSGSTSGVIAGIDWVTTNHQPGAPAVANMSLGGSASTALDAAVRRSISDGVTYGVAAGNGFFGFAQNACNYSPARVAEAITVGATEKTDRKASFSNFGTCLDIFAPGVNIKSAWNTSPTATSTISGTSMATPHVVGVAALYLQGNTGASPATVRNALVNNATVGKVTSPGNGSPNRLLFTNY
ncbi:MAG: S8 family peptidase [Anaerolineae bacterium]|nr:S8 family peptidase [Gemmatimonadaceae bacterium]